MHSVLGEMLAIPIQTGCLLTLTLRKYPPVLFLASSEIGTASLPHSIIVMPGKITVSYSDLTSNLVYLAALVPYVFSLWRDVSYVWQNRMPLCPYLLYPETFASHVFIQS